MNMSFEDQIRERAYYIWQAGGMADGQAHEHWVSAERAVRGEAASVEVILTKAAPRKAAAVKPATVKKATKAASAKSASAGAVAAKAPRARKAAPASHAAH